MKFDIIEENRIITIVERFGKINGTLFKYSLLSDIHWGTLFKSVNVHLLDLQFP